MNSMLTDRSALDSEYYGSKQYRETDWHSNEIRMRQQMIPQY